MAILNGIADLLSHPNPASPAQNDAYQSYIKDDDHYEWMKKVDLQVRKVQSGDAYKNLERMEVKIRTAEAGVYAAGEYIKGKESETDHGALRRNLDEVWEALNSELQKRAMYT